MNKPGRRCPLCGAMAEGTTAIASEDAQPQPGDFSIRWLYEHEGFNLGEGVYYLPDFWLPDRDCWMEVKPTRPSDADSVKIERLARQSKHEVIVPYSSRFFVPSGDGEAPIGTWVAVFTPLEGGHSGYWAECVQCMISGSAVFAGVWPSAHWLAHQEPAHPNEPPFPLPNSIRLEEAYAEARQARFEHRWR